MIRVRFKHTVDGEDVRIVASAKDVDAYGAVGLKLKFVDKDGEPVAVLFNRKVYEEIEELASDLLYERKYAKELEF